ncbi:four helix bundle protein [Fictibacillus phosphorivorans]|uniref:four helix bundle protein n=1 Tax=Fictibacillus phosphorivorans TaxID=1221500 RepID=UPI00129377E9|nr:four helix bundle protein [Fictibacillus phosphorivorans]MQR93690.1 four helix bundle protein [Fictibacillus phosphorivorans]
MKISKKQYVGNVRDLKVYGKALQFHKVIYEIVESLPDYERYNLSDMLRRSCSSMVANLAEGNTNFYYKKEYNHLNMVLSKIGECRSALDISRMAGYISESEYKNVDFKSEEILKMIIGMMRRTDRYLDNEQDDLDTAEAFHKSAILPIDISKVHKKVITLNSLISDLVLQYPIIERNNMKDQITRAAKSTLENLNNSKKSYYSQTYLDLNTALGSISETLAFSDISNLQGYITKSQYDEINKLGTEILDLVIDLMNHVNKEKYEEVYEWRE